MNPFDQALRVLGYAIAGPCVGALLGIVVFALLGGLITIPAVDWRHSDALADVAAGAITIGLILGTFLGVPMGALVGFLTGVVLGFRTPPAHPTTARTPGSRPSGKTCKPRGPFGDEFGTVQRFSAETPARRRKWWPIVLASLAVLFTALNLLWSYQRRYERYETAYRLQQIASGDARVSEQALERIRRLGPHAAPTIVDALRSNDLNARRAALLASKEVLDVCLGKLGEMNCVTGFIPGRGAASAGFQQITTAVAGILGDPDVSLRLDALRLLGGINEFHW